MIAIEERAHFLRVDWRAVVVAGIFVGLAASAALVWTVPVPGAWLEITARAVAAQDGRSITIYRTYKVNKACDGRPVKWVDPVDQDDRQLPSILSVDQPALLDSPGSFDVPWDPARPLPKMVRVRIECSGKEPSATSAFVPVVVYQAHDGPY